MLEKKGPNTDNILTSWKEIAQYMKCEPRTAKRYEATLGLPVHRISNSPKARVFAYREEIDVWRQQQSQMGAGKNHTKAHGHFKLRRVHFFLLPIFLFILSAAAVEIINGKSYSAYRLKMS